MQIHFIIRFISNLTNNAQLSYIVLVKPIPRFLSGFTLHFTQINHFFFHINYNLINGFTQTNHRPSIASVRPLINSFFQILNFQPIFLSGSLPSIKSLTSCTASLLIATPSSCIRAIIYCISSA